MVALSGDAMYIQKLRIYKVGIYVSTYSYIRGTTFSPIRQAKPDINLGMEMYWMSKGGHFLTLLPNPYILCFGSVNTVDCP